MFEGKVVLAPMVRVGSLPMRLLCLEYGADLVWGPETVDKKLIGSQRTINPTTGTIDYLKDGYLIFRMHPSERHRLIFQLGTADPELALQAALTVLPDVAGIDVNCGCPKRFSLQAGMGAALLKEPERLCAILRSLVSGLPAGFPVTAKIRVFDDMQHTLDLTRKIAATGIKALTVHARTQECRPRHPARWPYFTEIAKAIAPLPLIANGDIMDAESLAQLQQTVPGPVSWMVARGAQWNPSIFRRQGRLPVRKVSEDYLKLAVKYAMPFSNAKFTLLQMWIGEQERGDGSEQGVKKLLIQLQTCKSYDGFAEILGFTLDQPIVVDQELKDIDSE
jgi:tRNA-dihydrouridine synthase 2